MLRKLTATLPYPQIYVLIATQTEETSVLRAHLFCILPRERKKKKKILQKVRQKSSGTMPEA